MVRNKGFTLIELMVVVAIVGILAAVSYPSYQRYVQQTKRADTQTYMLSIAQRLEQYRSANMSYQNATLAAMNLSASYPLSNVALYDLSLTTTAGAWQLAATPRANTGQAGNGVICLNSQGQRDWDKGSATSAACLARLSTTSNWDGR